VAEVDVDGLRHAGEDGVEGEEDLGFSGKAFFG